MPENSGVPLVRSCFKALALFFISMILSDSARSQSPGQITFQTTTTAGDPVLWRIQAEAGSPPENLSVRLDSLALYSGRHDGPIMISPDGAWYTFYSERFDSNSQGWPGLTIVRADLQLVETVRSGGVTIHGEWAQAIAGGDTIVYVDGGGPHVRDVFAVERQGADWSQPRCLTTQSLFAWNYRPIVSANSSRLLFDAGDNAFPSTEICEVRLDGTGFRVVVTADSTPPGHSPSPAVHSGAYAPDGSIVFESEWDGTERLWRLPPAGGVPELINGTLTNDNSPNVLPNGQIVSLWLGSPGGMGLHEIKLMDPAGGTFAMLTDTSSPFYEVDDIGLGCGPRYNPSGVAESPLPGTGYRLGQNYPNPFNPSTTIQFTLPSSGFVMLKIFDLLGKEVVTLFEGELLAGQHAARWNASNASSSVYFYRLQAGEFTRTGKMMIVK